ncbi:MAG: ECF RNA polymerase sigma factor SigM [Syntrophomonadaceae bacterium]|nr:ECF RNA polymerase sigma factor SigM [Bacillota bacterium]
MIAIYLAVIHTEQDKNKFEILYTTYRKLMFYIANQILKDEYLAEDAIHQAFLKIIENLDKIENVHCHKTKSYIVIMVRNNAINLYNRRKRDTTVSLEQIEFCISDETFSWSEDLDYLANAVMRLPVLYKEVLTLKYVQELSNAEIAQTLDISAATVRKRLERARHKLEETLIKEGNPDVL